MESVVLTAFINWYHFSKFIFSLLTCQRRIHAYDPFLSWYNYSTRLHYVNKESVKLLKRSARYRRRKLFQKLSNHENFKQS